MSGPATAALRRALELSRELKTVADQGDMQSVMRLDLERLQLLKSARKGANAPDADERMLLQEIAQLNDQSLGLLEHHRRSKGRQLDMAAVGRRAVAAYSTTGRGQR